MLVDCPRVVVMRGGNEPEMAIRYDARHHYFFASQMREQQIVAQSDLMATQKDPGNRHHLLRIERDVQCECFPPDLEMLCVEHEDTDLFRCVPCDGGTKTNIAWQRSRHSPECRHMAHAPARCEPAIRATIQEIRPQPSCIFLVMLLVGTECLPAVPAMHAAFAVPMGLQAAAGPASDPFMGVTRIRYTIYLI